MVNENDADADDDDDDDDHGDDDDAENGYDGDADDENANDDDDDDGDVGVDAHHFHCPQALTPLIYYRWPQDDSIFSEIDRHSTKTMQLERISAPTSLH